MEISSNRKRGFTLVELMVAATIGLLALGAVLAVFLSINRSIYGLSDAIELNARTRIVQERILLDIRGITELTAIGAQSISGKYRDFASGNEHAIRYTLTAGTLTRSVNGQPATVVMTGLVTDPTLASYSRFSFSNRCGAVLPTTTTDPASVRAISFGLVPQSTVRQKRRLVPGTSDPFSSALIQLRNLQS